MMAQTSDKVSAIAARYLAITADQLMAMASMENSRKQLAQDLRSMAASCLAQDQHKGLRGIVRRAAKLLGNKE